MDALLVRGGRSRVEPVIPSPAAESEGSAYDIVFLDRDGTVNVRVPDGYVDDPERMLLLPGAGAAVARLNASGARVVVVTNQRGLATGRLTRAAYDAVTGRLADLLAAEGAHLDATYVCPHDHGECVCRKPADGLFRAALADAPWARAHRCAMVGDMRERYRWPGPRPRDAVAALLGVDVPDLGRRGRGPARRCSRRAGSSRAVQLTPALASQGRAALSRGHRASRAPAVEPPHRGGRGGGV